MDIAIYVNTSLRICRKTNREFYFSKWYEKSGETKDNNNDVISTNFFYRKHEQGPYCSV